MRTVTLAFVVLATSLLAVWGLARLGISLGGPMPAYTVTEMQVLEEAREQLDQRQQRLAVFSARLEAAKQDLVRGTTTLSDAVDDVLAESKRSGPHFITHLNKQEDGLSLRLRAALNLTWQVYWVCFYGGPREQWPSIRVRFRAELARWEGVTPEVLRRIPLDGPPTGPVPEMY